MDTKDFDVVAMRTDLHQIPELGFNEHKTSDYVAAKLKEMGLEPIRGIGGTGVVAYIDGTEPGPTDAACRHGRPSFCHRRKGRLHSRLRP